MNDLRELKRQLIKIISVLLVCTISAGFEMSSAAAYVDDSQLRLATEAFGEIGASVEYKYPEDTLTVKKDGQVAVLKLRSRLLYRDGKSYQLDREVVVYNDRAYVSPDAVEKAFGAPPERIVDPDKPMVCLTFDDGPYSPVTDSVLDVLEAYNSKATFFVVGNMIWQYPETLKRAKALGMGLGSHTYYHPHLTQCTWDQVVSELNMTNQAAEAVIGEGFGMLRPPHGESNAMVHYAAGVPIIKWNVDTLDWLYLNCDTIYHRAIDEISDGDIVLMHDLLDATKQAVWIMVPALLERGFQLVTVQEMIAAKGWTFDPGVEYYCVKP